MSLSRGRARAAARRLPFVRLLLLAALLAVGVQRVAVAQPAPAPAPAGPVLVIGTKDAPPFAMKGPDGQWTGIAIELWQRIAEQLHLRYRFEESSLQGLIDGVASGRFDAAVAALTVTAAREKRVDFSQPFYTTGLGIAVPSDPAMTWFPVVRSIFSLGFVRAILALAGVALLVGCIVWVFEHRHNEHFGGRPTRGLGWSMWWSALVMTQSGASAGERVPMTLGGRMIAVVWMTTSVIVIAAFTAALTSQLTTTRLHGLVHGPDDLRSVRTGAVAGTSTIGYLDREHIRHRAYATPQDALRALRAGKLDAVVYDKALLTWIARTQFSGSIQVLNTVFEPQTYAVALPIGGALRARIDPVLLANIESDWWRDLQFRYLGGT